MTETKRGRGRPRREGADDQILSVALEMFREHGYGALTVDAVAERAGVAKTTVYRRWPSKSALIAAAVPATETLDEAVALLRLFEPAQPEAIEVIAAILRPHHARLRQRAGEAEADKVVGTLLTRLFVTREGVRTPL